MRAVQLERRWQVLLLISIGSFMAFLDAPVVSVALPHINATFSSTSATSIAWVLDGYFIAFAALLVVAGRLSDRVGRRTMFILGLWLFTAASLVCGAAPTAAVLIAARVLQGIAAAMVVPAGQGIMLAEFPADQRKTAIGVLAAIVALATSVSPAVGGLITEGLSWRWIFYLNVFIGVAASLWAASLLARDEIQPDTPLPDAIGAGLVATAIALICLAILKRSEWGFGDARTLAALVVGIAALAVFLRRQTRHPAPILDLRLFRNFTFATANAGSLLFALAFYGSMINAVFYFARVWDYSVLKTGLAFLAGSLFGAVWGAPAGRWAERYGSPVVAAGGSLLAGVGLLVITLRTGSTPHYLSDWLPGQLAYGAGTVIALTGLVGGALTSAPPAQFALASGVNSAIRQVGGAIGVALVVGILSDATPGNLLGREHTAFAVCVVGFFLAALVALLARALQRAPARAQPETNVEPAKALEAR